MLGFDVGQWRRICCCGVVGMVWRYVVPMVVDCHCWRSAYLGVDVRCGEIGRPYVGVCDVDLGVTAIVVRLAS